MINAESVPSRARPFSPSSYGTPEKKRRITNELATLSPLACKIEEVSEDIFRVMPEQDAFKPDYGCKPAPAAKTAPTAPNRFSIRPHSKDISDQYLTAEHAWDQYFQNPLCARIGEGHFHIVLIHRGVPLVYKLPNSTEAMESAHNNKCFKTIRMMHEDYKTLLQAQKSGLFPHSFRIAKTTFDVQQAIITQEKCHRMLKRSDLNNPIIRRTIRELFRLGNEGFHNMDLSLQNLGLSIDGKILLIDFREENEENAGAFTTNLDKLLRTFAQGSKKTFEYLDPRT